MKKLLITGGNGFIGSNCLRLMRVNSFCNHFEVHAITRNISPCIGSDTRWHKFNLLSDDIDSLIREIKPHAILHLAWTTEHGKYWSDPANHAWVEKSKTLFDSFAANGGERFVFAGTCAEYNWSDAFCDEKVTSGYPTTLYGQSKLAAHEYFSDESRARGVSYVNGRIFSLYGCGEDPRRFVASLAQSALSGEEILMSDGEQWRDYLHVQDVANALLAMLSSSIGGAVNIASGEPVQLKKIAELICLDVLGHTQVLKLGARPRSANDPDKILANVERLNRELNWRPSFSLNEGLALVVKEMKKIS